MSVAGQAYSINWNSDLPINVAAGSTYDLSLSFTPSTKGAVPGQLAVTSNSANSGTLVIGLSGTGTDPSSSSPVLDTVTCTTVAYTGVGVDDCSVTLTAAAPTGGIAVGLASNNAAVTVPSSVTIPAGATNAAFTAAVATVSSAQTATLTANAAGVLKTFVLQLNTATAVLSINATSLPFGNVTVNTSATQSIILASTGALPVTVSTATLAGTGFSISGATFPVTLNSSQSLTLNVQFKPTVTGTANGTLTISSTSTRSPLTVISLSGTGVASVAHEVDLSWNAPTSSADPVVGYNIYRSANGTSSYQQINTSVVTQTTYVDTAVQTGQIYDYFVESVDASGVTSVPSNTATLTIP